MPTPMTRWVVVLGLLLTTPAPGTDPAREWRHELEQMGYEGREELLQILLVLRSEEQKELLLEAAYLLSIHGRPGDAEALERVAQDEMWSDEERVLFARGAARLDPDGGARFASGLLDTLRAPEARAQALALLAELGHAPRYRELLQVLEDGGPDERGEAVQALGRLARSDVAGDLDPPPVAALLGLVGDEDESVRWRAVLHLGSLLRDAGGETRRRVAESLCRRSREDPSEYVRRWAAFGLNAASADCPRPDRDP